MESSSIGNFNMSETQMERSYGLSFGQSLPKGIFLFFAVAGVFLVAAKLVSFVRVLLSLFILPGVSV